MIDQDQSNSDFVASEIREAQLQSGATADRLNHLRRAQEYIIHHDPSGSLLDNFLDEMLEFMTDRDPKIRIFVIGFILEACKKDVELIKKVLTHISWVMTDPGQNANVTKKVISVSCQLYPMLLAWVSKQRNADVDWERCWESFAILKGRIMQLINSQNEGIRTMTFKFLESCILCQTPKTPQSEGGKADCVSLEQIPRDHRFISYRQLEGESKQLVASLLDEMSSGHISSLNLLTALSCLTNIARQRPEFIEKVVLAVESLHVNLPPTLGTSQVKSVRKELKMHLLRLLKHGSSAPLHPQITTLLTDLGANQQEVLKALPATSELKRRMKKPADDAATDEASLKKRPKDEMDVEEGGNVAEEEEEEDTEDKESSGGRQSAIEITSQFLYNKLSARNVADLVLISLVSLPDDMPPSFQSSYTPIAAAGTEAQMRHLARMMATQFTTANVGPGVEQTRREARQKYLERQSAKNEGAIVPPTPVHVASALGRPLTTTASSSMPPPPPPQMHPKPVYGVNGQLQKVSKRLIQHGLSHVTRPMTAETRSQMIMMAFERVLNNEKRALQGGAALGRQKLLIRLSCRLIGGPWRNVLQETLIAFILSDQKARSDMAILWLYESYADFQAFLSKNITVNQEEEEDKYELYDRCLCRLIETLFERGEHKETLFHKILLEAPHITPNSLDCLKRACMDKVYGAFGMTTLREMILTRPRQRAELLKVLLDFSHYERVDLKIQSLETAKELFQLDWIRNDVKEFVEILLSDVLRPQPPPDLFGVDQGRAMEDNNQWDETTIRACLYLYLNLLPLDHSLIHKLAEVYAQANTDVKKVIFRVLETPVKAIGMHSQELLKLLDECPSGAETLVARIVHLLTERNAPTKDLVERLKNLHNSRQTDVRSLIPVLTGLEKEEILKALPKFVLSAAMQRSVQGVFSRLLRGKNIETGAAPMSASELLIELHKIPTKNNDELKYLIAAMKHLFGEANMYTKEVLASVIQSLIELNPMPPLVMRTILQALTLYPALIGFVVNVLHRLIGFQVWKYGKLWEGYVKCCRQTQPHCFQVLMHLPAQQLRLLFVTARQQGDDIQSHLVRHVQSLPSNQQSRIPVEIMRVMKEDPIKMEEITENVQMVSINNNSVNGGNTRLNVNNIDITPSE